MLRTAPPSAADTQAVCCMYDVGRDVRYIATHSSQKFAAVGCNNSDIKIIKIVDAFASCSIGEINTLSNVGQNSLISDITWNPIDVNKLAVGFANGQLRVLNFNEKPNKSEYLQAHWNGAISGIGINRVTWHPQEEYLLATGNSDGSIKFFDIREKNSDKSTSSFRGKGMSGSTRDVKFNAFSSDIFADASEGGRIRIWDRRSPTLPIMGNDTSHKGKVLCLAWSPFREWYLASGSTDRTVKLWDTAYCWVGHETNNNPMVANATTNTIPTNSIHGASTHGPPLPAPLEVCTLHTSGEVGKILWVCGDSTEIITGSSGPSTGPNSIPAGSNIMREYLVTINTPAQASAESNGYISVWNMSQPHVPVVLLKGHGSELCNSMDWIDCVLPSYQTAVAANTAALPIPTVTNSLPIGLSISSKSKKYSGTASNAANNATLPGPIALKRVPSNNKSIRGSGGVFSSSVNSPSASNPTQSNKSTASTNSAAAAAAAFLPIPCILSGGRDGKVLIQNLYAGYFPYQHLTPCVTAISSQGHVALHRGKIPTQCLSLPNRLYTKDISNNPAIVSGATVGSSSLLTSPYAVSSPLKPSSYHQNSSVINTPPPTSNNPLALMPTSVSIPDLTLLFSSPNSIYTATTASNPSFQFALDNTISNGAVSSLVNGAVVVGLADLPTLQDAMRVRNERSGGAEASVFDPALMYLLAKHYSFGKTWNYTTLNLSADEEQAWIQTALLEYCQYHPTTSLASQFSELFLLEDETKDSLLITSSSSPAAAPLGGTTTTCGTVISSKNNKQIDGELLQMYQNILIACEKNINIANIAGLKCRAAIWSSLLALIPFPSHHFTPKPAFNLLPTNAMIPSMLNLHMPLPFTNQLLANLLNELLEGGDAQHFVVVCELLRRVKLLATILSLAQIPPLRVRMIYMAYIDLLQKQELFVEANEIIKSSNDEYIATLSQRDVDIALKCNQCKRELPRYRRLEYNAHFAVTLAATTNGNNANGNNNSSESLKSLMSSSKRFDWTNNQQPHNGVLNRENSSDSVLSVLGVSGYARNTPVRCESCQLCVSHCAYCHQPVTGMIQWCPICAHGGHYACMKYWFSREKCCPTGCNHHCCASTICTTIPPSSPSYSPRSTASRLRRQRGRAKHRTLYRSDDPTATDGHDGSPGSGQGFSSLYDTDYTEYMLMKRRKELKSIRKAQLYEVLEEGGGESITVF